MSFTQCKDQKDVSLELERRKYRPSFITEDFRIYDELQLSTECGTIKVDPRLIVALWEFQTHLEMVNDEMLEMSFGTVVKEAKSLQKAFESTMKLIRYNPELREPRNPSAPAGKA